MKHPLHRAHNAYLPNGHSRIMTPKEGEAPPRKPASLRGNCNHTILRPESRGALPLLHGISYSFSQHAQRVAANSVGLEGGLRGASLSDSKLTLGPSPSLPQRAGIKPAPT